ncbi:hypothetical protein CH249_01205 [Rhodococcus sp. 05-2255-3B1]|uniref:hypothetical protein n=1 Tax=unclassified Rhodococcus (in: high G+C Gram-positive bacteria) TaxID=192944 RepID=UPI000B9B350B|nr:MULTISPECIES: hypothetical protein [unclassified Rhodococcus (in: high G+C Gram-positive bacteria)]OZE13482.1 hypothetical protein CH250_06155 [Rhodococcus sp. 05-2255-3C]OZE15902.1 hypothetical protein CH249_01205 [Rhodococcus sp. 05-2255-3B1]OZE18941.1 hypothetical protein CH255_13230 [Rhodococcus sp. 05-2255-2A2]
MSNPESNLKTLAIRLKPEVHAQLSFIAQLRGQTINDEGLLAVAAHIAQAKADPALLAKADEARQEIERDAAVRRDAIASMFDASTTDVANETRTARPRRTPKGEGAAPD